MAQATIMEENLKRLAGIFARVLKKTEEEVAEAVSSDETVSSLEQAFKDHITTVDTNGYKRAELKIKKEVEKALAAKGVQGADFDKLADGLEYVEQQALEKSGKSLSDEQVLSHPAVKKLQNQFITEKEQIATAAKTEAEKSLADKVNAFRREQTNATVEAEANRIIGELNPLFSQNATVAANQRRLLLDQLKAGQYEVKDGKLIALKEDGTYKTDDLGHAVKFDELVRSTVTSYYDLPLATDRQSAGLTQAQIDAARSGQKQMQHFKGKLPANENEYLELVNDTTANSYEARKELTAYWSEKGGQ